VGWSTGRDLRAAPRRIEYCVSIGKMGEWAEWERVG